MSRIERGFSLASYQALIGLIGLSVIGDMILDIPNYLTPRNIRLVNNDNGRGKAPIIQHDKDKIVVKIDGRTTVGAQIDEENYLFYDYRSSGIVRWAGRLVKKNRGLGMNGGHKNVVQNHSRLFENGLIVTHYTEK